jgi:hypothetical protein
VADSLPPTPPPLPPPIKNLLLHVPSKRKINAANDNSKEDSKRKRLAFDCNTPTVISGLFLILIVC